MFASSWNDGNVKKRKTFCFRLTELLWKWNFDERKIAFSFDLKTINNSILFVSFFFLYAKKEIFKTEKIFPDFFFSFVVLEFVDVFLHSSNIFSRAKIFPNLFGAERRVASSLERLRPVGKKNFIDKVNEKRYFLLFEPNRESPSEF